MHNAAIHALGLDAVYIALRAPAPALPAVLTALAAVGAAGNVTVPHKEAAERCITRKTDLCSRAGACNTFWTEHGELVGDNTDVAGIVDCVKQLGADGAGTWLLIGTGGAARAQSFADWARARGVRAEPARGALEPDIAVNATPLGLKEADPMPLDPARTERLSAALDLVYAPGETRWVRALRAAGIAAQDGREMLVRQGAAAFSRFFPDRVPPVEVMRAAVARALRA